MEDAENLVVAVLVVSLDSEAGKARGAGVLINASVQLVPRVAAAAERGGFDLVDLSVSEPSLETVFINLTGKELRD